MSIFGTTSKPSHLPEWESEGGLRIADALHQVLTAFGPSGFVQVRIRPGAERISSPTERLAARKEIEERGEFGQFYQEEDYPNLTVAEFRAMQAQRHVEYEAWKKRDRELVPIAYPFEYVVGCGADAVRYTMGRSATGRTWEEALAEARILGATERLRSPWA